MLTQFKIVTSHQVVLVFTDEADARAFLADAAPAQDAVREQLAAIHTDHAPTGSGDHGNGATSHDAVGMPKLARKKRAAAPAKKEGGAKRGVRSAPKVITKGLTYHCAECDRAFTSAGFLARHERQVHSGAAGPDAEHGAE